MNDDADRRAFKADLPETVAWFVQRTRYGYAVRFKERFCTRSEPSPPRPWHQMEDEARAWLQANGWWYHNRAHAWFPPKMESKNANVG